jgi:hypothetical protein
MSRPLPIGKWGGLPQFSGTFKRFFFIPGCLIIIPGSDFCSEFFFSFKKGRGRRRAQTKRDSAIFGCKRFAGRELPGFF